MKKLVLVAALGYFVDILDLFLFSVLRVPSLTAIGVPPDQLMAKGMLLLNAQMAGLLLGSVFFGVMGDRKGRVSVLYFSIALYSLATLANAFVGDVTTYAWLRFISGIGLSGELGVAITLVCESLPQEKRGWGTMFVAGVGLSGGIAASLLASFFSWSTCYLIGGIAGLSLLAFRLGIKDSAIFLSVASRPHRGNLLLLLKRPKRLATYLQLIAIGLPIWFISGILIIFSPEFTKLMGVTGPVVASQSVLYSYLGVTLGDFLSGAMSQWLKSRKQTLFYFLLGVGAAIAGYFSCRGISPTLFYFVCFLIGITTGYWAVLITTASEQFGTDLRATVTTTVPNLIRASVIPMTFLFERLVIHFDKLTSAMMVGTIAIALALISLLFLEESFTKDLAFTEGDSHVAT